MESLHGSFGLEVSRPKGIGSRRTVTIPRDLLLSQLRNTPEVRIGFRVSLKLE